MRDVVKGHTMYKNADNLRFGVAHLRALELSHEDVTHNSHFVFVAFASLFITIAFLVPFGDSWMRSVTYQEYFAADHVDAGTREGRLDRQIALGTLGLFGLAAVAWPGGKALRAGSALTILFIAYLAWCAATALWSDNVGMSVRRWTALMCEVLAGMAIAKRCSVREFVWIVLACTFAWLSVGICAELSLSTFKPWQPGYRFAGIFHPNMMGVNCALLTMAALYLATGEQRAGRWLYLFAIVGTVFLLLTGSRTALSAMLVSLTAGWFVVAPMNRKLIFAASVILVAGVGLIAAGLATFDGADDLVALGRTDSDASTFSGRVPLWKDLLAIYAPPRYLAGYGYGAFWTEYRILEISRLQGWSIPHAHSMYIDFVLNTGYVGAALAILTLIVALFSALRLEARQPHTGFGFIAMIVTYVLFGGLIETYIGITWFLSIFTLCGICFLLYPDQRSARAEGN
jgi:exopolysaccharide production protein ExoQ